MTKHKKSKPVKTEGPYRDILDERQCKVFIARVLEGKTYKAISEQFNISIGRTRQLYETAIRRLSDVKGKY